MQGAVVHGAARSPPRARRSSRAHAGLQDTGRTEQLQAATRRARPRARSTHAPSSSQPLAAVDAHRLDDRDQRAALLGQRVLDARRDLGVRLARDDALLLERPQAQRERARRDARRASARARRSATRPSARSRITSSVHLPQTMSAVRQTGQSEFGTKPKDIARLHELKLLQRRSPARAPRCRAPRPSGERVARARRARRTGRPCSPAARSPARTSRSPRSSAGPRGRAAVDDAAHEQAVALGQPDRGAHPARHARRRERDAEPRPLGRLAARQLADAAAQRGVGRQGEDEAAVAADGVEAEQVAGGVDQRTAGASRAAAAPCARSSRPRGARAGRGSRARSRTRGRTSCAARARRGWRARAPAHRPAGVSPGSHATGCASPVSTRDHRHVEVGVRARPRAPRHVAVGERDRHLVAAQHVRDGQHLAGGDRPRPSRGPSRARARPPPGRPCAAASVTACWTIASSTS